MAGRKPAAEDDFEELPTPAPSTPPSAVADDFEDERPMQKFARYGSNALGGAAKGFNYGLNWTGPVFDDFLGGIMGKELVKPGEAAKGRSFETLENYPQGSEILSRMGLKEGARVSDFAKGPFNALPGGAGMLAKAIPSLQFAEPGKATTWYQPEKGGMLDWSVRDAAGYAYDAARDPLTYLSLGGNQVYKAGSTALPRLSKALRIAAAPVTEARSFLKAPSRLVGKVGKSMYETGLLPIIQQGERKGKEVASTFYKHGVHGSSDDIAELATKAEKKLDELATAIHQEVDATGATIDKTRAFQKYIDYLQELVSEGRISHKEALAMAKDAIGTKMSHVGDTTEIASKWKSDLSELVPDAAREPSAGAPSILNRTRKVAAGGLKDEIERVVNDVGANQLQKPNLGDSLREINLERGDLKTVKKTVEREAQREARKMKLNTSDILTGLAGVMASGGEPITAGVYGGSAVLAKKLLEMRNWTRMRTTPGFGLMKLSENPLSSSALDIYSRRKAIELGQPVPEQDDFEEIK